VAAFNISDSITGIWEDMWWHWEKKKFGHIKLWTKPCLIL